jgi:hypothetical protein
MARNLRGKGVLWLKETRISFEKIPSLCYGVHPMAIQKRTAFSRRLPDLVTEELAAVLSSRSSFEFKDLFEKVYERLKARNAASGGEEMLRLRAYEKLQNLVSRGMVKKDVKKYKGIPKQLATLQTTPPPLPAPQPVEV